MDKNFQHLVNETIVSGNHRHDIELEKIGYDWANKKMLARVYTSLHDMFEMDFYGLKKTWTNIIRHMIAIEGKSINSIAVGGYYNSIRRNLKDIKVIEYKTINGVQSKELDKGPNWDRFFSDEDWSWFITDTNSGGRAEIIK
jgi:hypothetical protein